MAEIATDGPMTFARFMKLALYHDPLGYYRATPKAMTRSGDFLTSPETHPYFGRLLARFAAQVQRTLTSAAFTVVEQGAGTGALAETFVAAWAQENPGVALRYVVLEPHAGSAERLERRLGGSVAVVPDIRDVAPFSGLFLSNELPDAFPVHRMRRVDGILREVYVAVERDQLVESLRELSSPGLEEWLEFVGLDVAEGAEIEVSTEIGPWLRGIAGAMEAGRILTIDYGYDAREAGRYPRGTLLAHYRHATNEDFLQRIGMQDLTSHVCWTALERFGETAGLRVVERLTQREFLTRLGWKDLGRRLLATPGAGAAELDAVDRLGRMEDGLGGLKVLVQERVRGS